jgi:hypothetical protein
MRQVLDEQQAKIATKHACYQLHAVKQTTLAKRNALYMGYLLCIYYIDPLVPSQQTETCMRPLLPAQDTTS